jgi:hypothetical protein
LFLSWLVDVRGSRNLPHWNKPPLLLT